MLIEFCGLIMLIVAIVIAGSVVSRNMDKRLRDETKLHEAVLGVFYRSDCPKHAECSDHKIRVGDLKELRIRRPSGRHGEKDTGVDNDVLEGLYGELEKASKGGAGK